MLGLGGGGSSSSSTRVEADGRIKAALLASFFYDVYLLAVLPHASGSPVQTHAQALRAWIADDARHAGRANLGFCSVAERRVLLVCRASTTTRAPTTRAAPLRRQEDLSPMGAARRAMRLTPTSPQRKSCGSSCWPTRPPPYWAARTLPAS